VLVTNLAKSLEIRGRGGNVSAFAKYGLDENRSSLCWVGLLREEKVELMDTLSDCLLFGCVGW
jgi:hypothetical protein